MNQPIASSPWLRTLAAMCVLPAAVALRSSAQTAAPVPEKKIPVETVPADKAVVAEDEELLVLSPFTVNTAKDTGYFAENTLAGSRMKTRLSDLGASISVVTKAQLEDFASTDMNEMFRYEVNTEGSSTYTPQTAAFRGDGILDVNAGGTQGNSVTNYTNAGANRVRGLGVPSVAINYYKSIGAVPPDSYNTASFEISRGPNSMLFGVGSPAGVVNQSTQQAAINKNLNRVSFTFDDRGSRRMNLSFNRDLIHDKLAIYGSFLWDNKQFERKPSYDNTRRLYGALTYKPFSKTVIKANFEDYTNHNRRPNTVSPIDLVTQWNLAGRPTYDALTKRVTYLTTGQVTGPYISSASSTLNATANAQMVRDYVMSLPGYNPLLRNVQDNNTFATYNGVSIFGQTAINNTASVLYVPSFGEMNQGRATQQIGNGQLQNWYQPLYNQAYRSAYNIPGAGGTPLPPLSNNPISNMWGSAINSDIYDRDTFQSIGWTNLPAVTNVGSYKYAGVTDRAIYDWREININEANFGSQSNRNYNLEFEQQITKDLFLSVGWFRQDFKQSTNYTIAQLNATALSVDVNKYMPDGTLNPYFGLPFVMDRDPDRYVMTEKADHYRALLAYTPDFTNKDGWMKWLGRHQALGMWSRDDSDASATRMRRNYVGAGSPEAAYRYLPNPNNNFNGTRTGWSYHTTGAVMERHFYLANPGDPMGQVTRSTGEWNADEHTGNIRVYNYAAGRFEDVSVTQKFNTFDAPSRTETYLDSWSTGLTSYLWKERLVTTFGARLDKFRARQTTTGQIRRDGIVYAALTPQEKFSTDGYFIRDSMWNRFNNQHRATGRTKTGGAVLRPFSGWSGIESRAGSGSQFWQVVRDFGLSYNWSNNFDPPLGPENDAFGKPLDKAYGVGHDIGFQFTALNGKLFARVTWFEATNINRRYASGSALSRLTSNIDTTLFRGWSRTIAVLNRGDAIRGNPLVTGFDTGWTPAEELEIQAATSAVWRQAYNYYGDLPGPITTTQDAKSEGVEVQINYNTGNWRNRFTFGKQETVNFNVLKQFDSWYAERAPIWMSSNAADFMTPAARALYTRPDGSIAYNSFGNTDPVPNVNLTNFWSSYGFNSAVRLNDAFGNTNVANYYGINVAGQVQFSKDLNNQAAPNQRKYRAAYNTGYDFTSRMLKGFGIGGAERWESKAVIGYYGRAAQTTTNLNLLDVSDVSRPIYNKDNFYTDLFVKYRRKVWNNKVDWTIQLNVENVTEDGHLQVVAVNYDASPYGYRIIDSRKFTLTSTFEF